MNTITLNPEVDGQSDAYRAFSDELNRQMDQRMAFRLNEAEARQEKQLFDEGIRLWKELVTREHSSPHYAAMTDALLKYYNRIAYSPGRAQAREIIRDAMREQFPTILERLSSSETPDEQVADIALVDKFMEETSDLAPEGKLPEIIDEVLDRLPQWLSTEAEVKNFAGTIQLGLDNGTEEQRHDLQDLGLAMLASDDSKQREFAIQNVMGYIPHYGTEEQKTELDQTILTLLNSEGKEQQDAALRSLPVTLSDNEADDPLRETIETRLKEIVTTYKLPYEQLRMISREYKGAEYYLETLVRNIRAIELLEAERPNVGITHILNRDFGLLNFGFYPPDLLVRQFDERDQEGAYALFGLPILDDVNREDAFAHPEVWDRYRKNVNQLASGGWKFRFIELREQLQARHLLHNMTRRYGQVSDGVMSLHGFGAGVVFSDTAFKAPTTKEERLAFMQHMPRRRMSLDTEQLQQDDRTERLKLDFIKHPRIVLTACETGRDGGFAQALSAFLDAEVIAPNMTAQVKDINVEFIDGQPHWTMSSLGQAEVIRYISGVRIENEPAAA